MTRSWRTIRRTVAESGGLRRMMMRRWLPKKCGGSTWAKASPEEEAAGGEAAGSDLAGKSKEELLAIFAKMLEERPVQSLRRDVEALKIAFYKLRRAESDAARRAFRRSRRSGGGFRVRAGSGGAAFQGSFPGVPPSAGRVRRRTRSGQGGESQDKVADYRGTQGAGLVGRDAQPDFQQVPGVAASLERDRRGAPAECEGSVGNLQPARGEFLQFHQDQQGVARSRPEEELRAEAGSVRTGRSAGARTVDRRAFHKLQKLHDEWREIGPVANEYKEVLWNRFKEASSRINKQHQEFFENIKQEQLRNLELKSELCVKAEELAQQPLTSRKEWNKASEKLFEIQKVWKTIGFAPKKDNNAIYERFRNACDKFFEAKRTLLCRVEGRDGAQPPAQDRVVRGGRSAARQRGVEEDDR